VEPEREAFEAFLAGEELPEHSPEYDAWLTQVAGATSAGRRFERIRLVTEPLTDYTRFEFAAYPENIAAGERVWILPRALLTDADERWAAEDFWIFDDQVAVVLGYDDDGCFLGVERIEQIEPYLDAKRRALELSVEFDRFAAQLDR
jgi:hypothetical protein